MNGPGAPRTIRRPVVTVGLGPTITWPFAFAEFHARLRSPKMTPDRQSTICVLDTRGRKLSTQTIRGGWSKVLEKPGKAKKPFAICFEASSGYGFLFEQLRLSKTSCVPAERVR